MAHETLALQIECASPTNGKSLHYTKKRKSTDQKMIINTMKQLRNK